MKSEIEHDAVEMLVGGELLERSLGRIDCCDLDVLVVDELDNRLTLVSIVLHHEQVLRHVCYEARDLRERALQRLFADWLGEIRHGPRLEALLAAFDSADDVNRYVT